MPEAAAAARILVIDDQEATRYIFRRILTHAGYAVDEASTGAAGLEKALTLPDLIIVDVNLPDMLGYDVCRRLRSNPLTLSTPVLQMSASFVTEESKVQALEGGADSYLTQPIEPQILLAQVNALLRLRRAETLSNLSARQWQTTFDALSDGLALIDPQGAIVRVNRTFLDLLDYVSSEIEGRPIETIFAERFELPFAEVVERCVGGHPVELHAGSRWFRVRYDQIEADPEFKAGAVLLLTDITDHRKLQETLKLSERLAATGRLAHIIAHEINNPLEAMSNLIYLALTGVDEASEPHKYLEQASSELLRVSEITKQVLAYHRESKLPILTDSRELLNGVLAMFRSQMLGESVTVQTDLRCSIPLRIRPNEIRQVFNNIISNALDAFAHRGGSMRIRCVHSLDPKTGVKGLRFLFSDTGPGIPPAVLPRIFDGFYTTKELQGSGIGLWLSAEIVSKHGGCIRVRTRTAGPHRGTLFTVFLPAPAAEDSHPLYPR